MIKQLLLLPEGLFYTSKDWLSWDDYYPLQKFVASMNVSPSWSTCFQLATHSFWVSSHPKPHPDVSSEVLGVSCKQPCSMPPSIICWALESPNSAAANKYTPCARAVGSCVVSAKTMEVMLRHGLLQCCCVWILRPYRDVQNRKGSESCLYLSRYIVICTVTSKFWRIWNQLRQVSGSGVLGPE